MENEQREVENEPSELSERQVESTDRQRGRPLLEKSREKVDGESKNKRNSTSRHIIEQLYVVQHGQRYKDASQMNLKSFTLDNLHTME